MDLASLAKVKRQKTAKRLGRGHSTGKGKTSGRGQKGQKARGKVRLGFEGGQTPLFKRLPFHKGKGNTKITPKPKLITFADIATLKVGSTVTIEALVAANIVTAYDAWHSGIKLLADGAITGAYHIAIPASLNAKKKIEEAGGTLVSVAKE